MKAKDINSQKFEKAAFGYKQEDVDGFLNELAADYSQLEKDNEEINTKLQVLADKVREYRKDEDAVKDALLFAQKEGHRVVSEANAKAEEIINNAKLEAEKIISEATVDSQKAIDDIKIKLNNEKASFAYTQKQVSDFKKSLFDMYKAHLELISSMPQVEDSEEEEDEVPQQEVYSAPVQKSAQPMNQAQPVNQIPIENTRHNIPPQRQEAPAAEKLDPFRTQSIPVIGAVDNKYSELQFGQQHK